MENKWELYQKTLNNIYKNQRIFMKMIIYYYNLIIKDKLKDINYIKSNYNIDEADFKLFNEYMLETKNIGIFTFFNNIPDLLHPLDEQDYCNYGCYVSFMDPNYFKLQDTNIIILKNNIWKEDTYKYPYLYQIVAPYNKYKQYIYINIKYYDHKKYNNCLLLKVNKKKEIYSHDNNGFKKRINDKWVKIDESKITDFDWIYVGVLRKIDTKDILNVFNVSKNIKKGTLLYSNHGKEKPKEKLTFFGLIPNHILRDPFNEKNELELMQHIYKLKKDISVVNLSCDILSNNELSKTHSIDELIEDGIKPNTIYNANLNYIKYNKIPKLVWKYNYSKRFFYEIFYKSCNFRRVDYYYLNILHNKFKIDQFINTYGYYNKFNYIYSYELGFYKHDSELLEEVNIKKINVSYNL